MIMVLIDAIKCFAAGFVCGVDAFLRVLPLYEQLSGLKDELISAATGIPIIVLTIIGLIPISIKVVRLVFYKFDI